MPDNFNRSCSGYLCLSSKTIRAFCRSFALPQELRHSVFLSIITPILYSALYFLCCLLLVIKYAPQRCLTFGVHIKSTQKKL